MKVGQEGHAEMEGGVDRVDVRRDMGLGRHSR